MAEPTLRIPAQEIQRLLAATTDWSTAAPIQRWQTVSLEKPDAALLFAAPAIIAQLLEDRRVLREALESNLPQPEPCEIWGRRAALITACPNCRLREALEATRPEGSPLGQP